MSHRIVYTCDHRSWQGNDDNAERFVDFSAEAVCELVPGGKYRGVELKPGAFD